MNLLAWVWLSAVLAFPASSVAPWPHGLVTYWVDPSVGAGDRKALDQALAAWSAAGSPVRFLRTEPDSWAEFLWKAGLNRSLWIREDKTLDTFGTTTLGAGGWRQLVFNPDQTPPQWLAADLTHELGHVVGLTHEHQRRDRDLYVAFPRGFLEGLSPDRAADYAVDPSDPAPGDTRPYDYQSIMHYSSNIDGNRMVRRDTGAFIPIPSVPSAGDWKRLERLYR